MAVRSKGVNAAHTAGIFADMTLDGPEIGTLVAVVDRAKNLPNRKTMGKQDPYCAMRLGKDAKKTDTDKRGGQTPRWDQELRFTVHDSPDYYKLKCSVFNDDKKTDLISEAWIDLQDVIVPGGGQSDQWRQLNFKGKYAGDIRIELTYYDTRPKPDVPVESRKPRDKSNSIASDAASTASGPRQLGPREIKRRPLPPGPGGSSSPVSAALTASERWPAEEQLESHGKHGYTNSNPPPRPPKQKFVPETPDDVGYDLNPQFGPDSYEPQYESSHSYHERLTSSDFQNLEPSNGPYSEAEPFPEDAYQRRQLPAQPVQPRSVSELPPPEQPFQPSSQPPYDVTNRSSYRSPPVTPPAAAAQNQQWNGRPSASPTKYAAYRDSPLRQSVSQADMLPTVPNYPDQRFDEDEPPPPPPAHRGQISRTAKLPSAQYEDSHDQTALPAPIAAPYRDPYGQQSPRTPVKFQSVEDRSPLQRLEHGYDQSQATTPPAQEIQHQMPAFEPYEPNQLADNDRYPPFATEKRKSNNYNLDQLRPTASANDTAPLEQLPDHNLIQRQYQENPRADVRHSMGYAAPRRAQTFDNFELQDGRHARKSDLVIVRPRPISPNPSHTIPRKSITPTPGDRRSMDTVPYGPDSYDSFNPGTSPTVNNGGYSASEDALEASRQKDIDKLQDQGPIIGNDGRVIDPSDHLPADTWAPEPERKQRRPEHVIKIRTREEARLHRGSGSSPSSARPHSIATSPFPPSPHGPASSPYHSSPPAALSSPQVESPSGRNRLRKPIPQRPLPTEPYTHPQSSPAVPTLPSVDTRPSPSSHRYTIHSSPAGGLPPRPPISDYQVPAANNHSPHGGSGSGPRRSFEYRPDYTQQTPTKMPYSNRQQPEMMGYGGRPPYGEDNPLALELSRIDIGPSMSRTTLRPQKAYGAY
ncbi:hypothetical protein G647_04175 [Cladophialophora carrionii CBS 160.54]|uniref:C2 domain-containing protein n=1 Tax=Cladophialophora carrionii CBS 160.54 TaxID=1279043 RepID=V9DD71_9EURO|nr:uncharacterized protein G647_04175 [Cladophialophora carrionii CBS 160.54]ETI24805.1 hypothetical protein G647_04175 [Cladophialophora carrionii CBS 160.54]